MTRPTIRLVPASDSLPGLLEQERGHSRAAPMIRLGLLPLLFWFHLSLLCGGWTAVAVEPGNEPVAEAEVSAARITAFVQDRWTESGLTPASRCTDRQFARRVYLDLAGRIPRPDEVQAFLADGRAEKRRHLVELLTQSEDFVQHFADLLDALLMGRTTDHEYGQRIKHGWREFLQRCVRENRPWDEVVREIVLARPLEPEDHGSVWFLYERKDKFQEIAEAVAPAVFGIRVECAQCHDHPIADEIEQAHYWGLVAFFSRGKNVSTDQGPRVSESAIGGFSQFADLTGESRPNELAFLQSTSVDEPRPQQDVKQEDRDDLYRPATVTGDPRAPKFSRRAKFADEIVSSHPMVARAMVNRVWAILMGRGIVHPFDEMDSAHQPSHPDLLDWLSRDFESSGFDTRRLVRVIALSEPYQLSSLRRQGLEDPSTFAWYLERPLTAEQLARSMQIGLRGEIRNDDALLRKIRSCIVEVMPEENVTSVKTALFLTNHSAVNEFIRESGGENYLVSRLISMSSPSDSCELLFQAIFSRSPSEDEQRAVEDYLGRAGDSKTRWPQIVWSLVTSAEFRFNH
jgi:hypothetical protein